LYDKGINISFTHMHGHPHSRPDALARAMYIHMTVVFILAQVNTNHIHGCILSHAHSQHGTLRACTGRLHRPLAQTACTGRLHRPIHRNRMWLRLLPPKYAANPTAHRAQLVDVTSSSRMQTDSRTHLRHNACPSVLPVKRGTTRLPLDVPTRTQPFPCSVRGRAPCG